jgi:magnesium-transporting ATPase (P-type)
MAEVERPNTHETLFERLFPRRFDNTYTGSKIALWVFAFVITIRAIQSILIIVNGYSIAQSADGIPLETYPAAAAQTIVALFALSSLNRLIISLIGAAVLIRYRRAVPIMFVVLGLTYLGTQLITTFIPFVRVGTPPGVIMNRLLIGLTIIGLVLSLWQRRSKSRAVGAD